MIAFEPTQTEIPESEGYSVAVIGIGGAGCNLLDRIALDGIDNAALVAMNADVRALTNAMAPHKIQLGRDVTRGLGAGGDPELGQEAAAATVEEIREVVARKDIVLICTGLGGGTGSGAAPFVARAAREAGAFVVAFSIMPFVFEGRRRRRQAEAALGELSGLADALMTFENGRMGELVLPKEGIQAAFAAADEVVSQSVRAVLGMVQRPGLIRIGLDDLLSALRNPDSRCLFGFGQAKGDNRAQEALARAMRSPLLDRGTMLERARNVVVHVCGGNSMTLYEVELLMGELGREITDEAQILFGVTNDPRLGDALSVTIISSLANVAEPSADFQSTATAVSTTAVASSDEAAEHVMAGTPGATTEHEECPEPAVLHEDVVNEEAEEDLLAGLKAVAAPDEEKEQEDVPPAIDELLDIHPVREEIEEIEEIEAVVEAVVEVVEFKDADEALPVAAVPTESREHEFASADETEEAVAHDEDDEDFVAEEDDEFEDEVLDSPFTEVGVDSEEEEEEEEVEAFEETEGEAEEECFADEEEEGARIPAGRDERFAEAFDEEEELTEEVRPPMERERATAEPRARDQRANYGDALDEDDGYEDYRGRAGTRDRETIGADARHREHDRVDDDFGIDDERVEPAPRTRGREEIPTGRFDDEGEDDLERPRYEDRRPPVTRDSGDVRGERHEPAAPSRTRKPSPQTELEFEPASRGRFDRGTPTIVDGEDLDVPTILRQGGRRGGRTRR